MVKYALAVGAEAFWTRAAADIAAARRRVLVQAMTFEGDAAGRRVFDAIAAATASDRRILVDSYSRMVINDRFVRSPAWFDAAFRAEVRATDAMFRGAAGHGVGVRRTNPVGRNPVRYGVRNHKKLLVMDDVAWLGGVNFSDHNFAWADMMLRIDDAAAADFLARDFHQTWDGESKSATVRFGDVTIVSLDGRSNAAGFGAVFDAIAAARASIVMVSAYPTSPFVDALEAAARRGVAVEILTPRDTNKPIVRDALLAQPPVPGLTIGLTPGMSHLKGMLIDDALLVTGSSNFDFASYVANEEFVALVEDAALAADFRARVIEPARAAAVSPAGHVPPGWRGLAARTGLTIARRAIAPLARARRTTIPWT